MWNGSNLEKKYAAYMHTGAKITSTRDAKLDRSSTKNQMDENEQEWNETLNGPASHTNSNSKNATKSTVGCPSKRSTTLMVELTTTAQTRLFRKQRGNGKSENCEEQHSKKKQRADKISTWK